MTELCPLSLSLPSPLSTNIRSVTLEDAAPLSEILAHYVRTSVLTLDTEEPNPVTFEQKIADVQNFGGPFLVLENLNGAVIGFAYAGRYRPKAGYNSSVEITIYLHPDYTGQGLAHPLIAELLDQCQQRGYKLAISVITVDPAIGAEKMPSGKFHLAMGFTYIGSIENIATKFDRFWDTATFVFDLCPERTAP